MGSPSQTGEAYSKTGLILRMQKWAVFCLISKLPLNFNVLIVFSLWIFDEFEKFGWQFVCNKQIILWIQSLLININALEKLGIKNKKEIEKIWKIKDKNNENIIFFGRLYSFEYINCLILFNDNHYANFIIFYYNVL